MTILIFFSDLLLMFPETIEPKMHNFFSRAMSINLANIWIDLSEDDLDIEVCFVELPIIILSYSETIKPRVLPYNLLQLSFGVAVSVIC